MKYLYLQFLRLKIWLVRRRLRRLTLNEPKNTPEFQVLPPDTRTYLEEQKRIRERGTLIMILIAVLSLWIWLRLFEPVQFFVTPAIQPETSPRTLVNPVGPHGNPYFSYYVI